MKDESKLARCLLNNYYGYICILDPENKFSEPPEVDEESLLEASDSEIHIFLKTTDNSPVELILGYGNGSEGLYKIFDEFLDTPSGKVSIEDMFTTELLSVSVFTESTHIRIFAENLELPKKIFVQILE